MRAGQGGRADEAELGAQALAAEGGDDLEAGDGPPAADSAARTWVASWPRRRTTTSMTSGPSRATGTQKMAVADNGFSVGSSSSAAIARRAAVMSTPPEGMK